MTYGTIKVDTVTFTNAGVDKSVTLSGLVQNPVFSGNVTVTGTLSGVTVTGTTANFTSGNFTNISGGTHTITSGVFAAGSAASPSITFTGDLNTGIYSPGADQVAISTGGSGRLFVDASGQVGIGATPSYYLDVNGAGRFRGEANTNLYLTSTSDSGSNRIWFGDPTSGTSGSLQYDHTGNNLTFHTNGFSERLRITSAGLVGVGTSSPAQILHCTTTNGTASQLQFTQQFQREYRIGVPASSTSFEVYDVSAGASRLTIDSSGRLGVGTTSVASILHTSGSSDQAVTIQTTTAGADTRINFRNSAGTDAGGIQYLHNGNHLLFNTNSGERVRIDGSGRVGIGASSVNDLLHLRNGSSFAIRLDDTSNTHFIAAITSPDNFGNGTTAGQLYLRGAAGIGFSGNGGTSIGVVVDSSNRVGIGTTSPSERLHVSGGNSRFDGDYVSFGNNGYIRTDATGELRFQSGSSGTTFWNTGLSSEMARFDTSGRLLVGTSTTSAAPLTINGTIEANSSLYRAVFGNGYVDGDSQVLTGSNGAEVQIQAATSNRLPVLSIGGAMGSSEGLGAITFFNSGNTDGKRCRAAIYAVQEGATSNEQGARLVFSTTADGASSPTERMRIRNDGVLASFSAGDNGIFQTAAAAGTTVAVLNGYYGATANYTGAGTRSFLVWSNGNVQNTNNSYTAISDIKLKENIVDASSQWADLKALRVRNYNFKEGQTHRQIGLIAQEVEPISPGLVYESPDRDAEGNDLGTVTKSVNYSVLYMKAVKALQEAMERIETLEAKVAALENA